MCKVYGSFVYTNIPIKQDIWRLLALTIPKRIHVVLIYTWDRKLSITKLQRNLKIFKDESVSRKDKTSHKAVLSEPLIHEFVCLNKQKTLKDTKLEVPCPKKYALNSCLTYFSSLSIRKLKSWQQTCNKNSAIHCKVISLKIKDTALIYYRRSF